ncbi:6-phosphogluconolactonase (6PGL) [Vairimorpha necatrix]|uniref:6-phosphogluconolactonase (6PGL) n=1 Tax=Vairimorpha necatrix TaxID=6039 RepID=A0AAX4JBK7_9MICR
MKYCLTQDFKLEIFNLLQNCDKQPLNLMIAGGSLLSILDNNKISTLDSSKWKIFYADERCQITHSNYIGSKPFLSHLKTNNINKIDVVVDDPVAHYTNLLEPIDLCLLGIGGDGHICSLFPDLDDLDYKSDVIKVFNPNVVSPDRITVTLNFLNTKVRNLYFVIPPKDKVKDIVKPHDRICDRLKIDYTCIIDKRFNI